MNNAASPSPPPPLHPFPNPNPPQPPGPPFPLFFSFLLPDRLVNSNSYLYKIDNKNMGNLQISPRITGEFTIKSLKKQFQLYP